MADLGLNIKYLKIIITFEQLIYSNPSLWRDKCTQTIRQTFYLQSIFLPVWTAVF